MRDMPGSPEVRWVGLEDLPEPISPRRLPTLRLNKLGKKSPGWGGLRWLQQDKGDTATRGAGLEMCWAGLPRAAAPSVANLLCATLLPFVASSKLGNTSPPCTPLMAGVLTQGLVQSGTGSVGVSQSQVPEFRPQACAS